MEGKIVARFDCYEGTSAKAKLSKDLRIQGVNFYARKPALTKLFGRIPQKVEDTAYK